MKKAILSILILFSSIHIYSQYDYRSPLDIPLILSANFGELRPNHFHTGLDIKTQGVINKQVYSIADGYVSRISVSPSGYGLAIYVDHPATGQTSVYGHLNKFTPAIAKYVKDKQYEKENYKVDLNLLPEQFPLKKGDLIAYSGNTGSSGGPHLHFEIRDTKTKHALDPLPYYKKIIDDNIAPIIKGIAVYPIAGKGVVNNSSNALRQVITPLKEGGFSPINKKADVWGLIGIGIHANDRMSKTSNIYGVKTVRLYVDNSLIFSSNINEVDFDQSRMINSLTDFDYWYKTKGFYMRSFVEPANYLQVYPAISTNNGYLNIDEEREYKLKYELEDAYGNKTSYNFAVNGKKQEIPQMKLCSQAMVWNHNNHYITEDFSLIIPSGNLYNDICFTLKEEKDSVYFSNKYTVNDNYIPLDKSAYIKIKLTKDTLINKRQYGIIALDGKKPVWTDSQYENGYVTAKIRELGHTYAVATDIKAPDITPIQPENWKTKKVITIKVTDNISGIENYRGTLNGQYALFKHDIKSANYIYELDPERLIKGEKYLLEFTTNDAAGNTASYSYEFTY